MEQIVEMVLLINSRCFKKSLLNLFLVKVIKLLHINWINIINKHKINNKITNKQNYDMIFICI